MMLNKIYTFGYGNCSSLDPLVLLLKKYSIDLVIDVRVKPRGWSFKWSEPYLKKFFEEKYISVPELGNTTGTKTWIPPDWKKAKIKLKEISLLKGRTILLLCSEKEYTRCHRTEVAEMLSKMSSTKIKHLHAEEVLPIAV